MCRSYRSCSGRACSLGGWAGLRAARRRKEGAGRAGAPPGWCAVPRRSRARAAKRATKRARAPRAPRWRCERRRRTQCKQLAVVGAVVARVGLVALGERKDQLLRLLAVRRLDRHLALVVNREDSALGEEIGAGNGGVLDPDDGALLDAALLFALLCHPLGWRSARAGERIERGALATHARRSWSTALAPWPEIAPRDIRNS
jgi:hypothetical protein